MTALIEEIATITLKGKFRERNQWLFGIAASILFDRIAGGAIDDDAACG
jgi:hypothetical protein